MKIRKTSENGNGTNVAVARPVVYADIDVDIDVHPQKLDVQRVTASSSHPGPYSCINVLNGRMGQDGGADWSTYGEGPGAWIQLDLGKLCTITHFKFAGRVRDDKFKKVRVSFCNDGDDGGTHAKKNSNHTRSQEFEFPHNTLLNSFDLNPPVATTMVRITCLTCYNIGPINRGAQAIELWGFENNHVKGQPKQNDEDDDNMEPFSVEGTVVDDDEEGIPVITFRLSNDHPNTDGNHDGNHDVDDDNDVCAIIDGESLNKHSTMESIMESEDIFAELGITGQRDPSEYKFSIKRKQKSSSPIPLQWKQFRSMTVYRLSCLQNIDKNYLITMKEKKSIIQSRVALEKEKLEELSEKVLAVSKSVDELVKCTRQLPHEQEKRLPYGNYYIKTTAHEPSGQVAGWGLSAWQLHGGARNGGSSWVATHEGTHWPCVWTVEAGKKPNTYRIKTHYHAAGNQPAGWGLSAWQLHGGRRNNGSSRVAVHNGDHWPMDWEIVPGKKAGTWRVITTYHADGGQPGGWGLASWGPKVGDTVRNTASSWVHVHEGDHWPMDWVFERVRS